MHVEVLAAINGQINSEFSAWYQYLAMAAFCEKIHRGGALAEGTKRRGI
jgi:ferritin